MRTTKVIHALGLTINLGNYESARADVSVEIEADSNEDSAFNMENQAHYQVRQDLWESIQPFVGNWTAQRKRELAERLGVVLENDDVQY